MHIDRALLTRQFDELKKDGKVPSAFDCELEANHVADLAEGELSDFLKDYEGTSIEALGAGGSSTVVSFIYVPFTVRRAVKVPRHRVYHSDRPEDQPPVLDPEMHALSKLSHKSITRFYDSKQFTKGKGFCYVTECVLQAQPLHKYAVALCATEDCKDNDVVLSERLRVLAQQLYAITDALEYMHVAARLLHFDIKPDNLLVSGDGRPYVTDLGFARDCTQYKPDDDVKVGFTSKYAHPFLLEHALVSQTSARAKNHIPASAMLPHLDLFAFGRTVQEVLKALEDVHGPHVHSLYCFSYLHVVACMCLDGNNAPNNHMVKGMQFVSDQAMKLPVALFGKHRFTTFTQVKIALERLLGLRRLEDEVPELDEWSQYKLNASDVGALTFTPRINALLKHPLLGRMSSELQLGMLDTIYPTATHTRLQHSLGVYHAATQYLVALYYDPDNPTFRILFTADHAKRVMLAAMLHDLGQATFGHELEEIAEKEFSHGKIGEALLGCESVHDAKHRSLKQIVEGTDYDCWNVPLSDVTDLLNGKVSLPIDVVLHDILDGQLDADKLDFLLRDSVECRVPYGHGIDVRRFLCMLTTLGDETKSRVPLLRLAVKRKGAASAEGFALARYQLYQAVYWHHAFRAVKAMLITAARAAFTQFEGDMLFDQEWQLKSYLKHVVGVDVVTPVLQTEGKAKYKAKETVLARIDRMLAKREPIPARGKYALDRTLEFLWNLSSAEKDRKALADAQRNAKVLAELERGRMLLLDLCEREYYKRVFEMPLSALKIEAATDLRGAFRGSKREEIQTAVNDSLTKLLRTTIQNKSKVRESLARDEVLEDFEKVVACKHAFLVDLPTRGWLASGDDPPFVSDYKRRHFRADAGDERGSESGALWSRHLGEMMRGIACFRVFCEPQLHKILTRVLDADDIAGAMLETVPELKKRSK